MDIHSLGDTIHAPTFTVQHAALAPTFNLCYTVLPTLREQAIYPEQFALAALQLRTYIQEQTNHQSKGELFSLLSTLYRLAGEPKQAVHTAQSAMSLLRNTGPEQAYCVAWIRYAQALQANAEFPKAHREYERIMKRTEQVSWEHILHFARQHYATCLFDMQEFSRSLTEFQAVHAYRSIHSSTLLQQSTTYAIQQVLEFVK